MFDSALSIALAIVGAVLVAVGIGVAVSKGAWTIGRAAGDRKAARTVLWSLAFIFAGAAFWLVLAWTTEGVPLLSSGLFTAVVCLAALGQIPMLYRAIPRVRERNE